MTSKLIVQKCDITTKDILEILNYVILFKMKWNSMLTI